MTTLSPTQKMAVMHGMTIQALNAAVLNPTEENLQTFVVWQNFWLHQAGQFTNQWKAMLLAHPEMDYAVTHPHENLTASIQAAQHHTEEDQAIQKLALHNGFFFFYRGGNKLDQTLAPSLSAFARETGISLIAVSMDGTVLPAFAQSRLDHGQAKALGIAHFPALLLINPTTRAITPVNYGFISMDELRNRLWHIANHWKPEAPHV